RRRCSSSIRSARAWAMGAHLIASGPSPPRPSSPYPSPPPPPGEKGEKRQEKSCLQTPSLPVRVGGRSRERGGRGSEGFGGYNPPPMPFSKLDTAAVARTLSQIAEQPDDVVDAFFERREEAELQEPGALRVWREEGFAVRLAREGRTWLATPDAIESEPL